MNASQLISLLTSVQSENVFNPYTDRCLRYDRFNAPQIRRSNLRGLWRAVMTRGVDSLWVGRDLGYLGGRRTGLALTSEPELTAAAQRYGIALNKATKGDVLGERTAACIWQQLPVIDAPIFMWNVFPFHPYFAGEPFSNRAHTAAERRIGLAILEPIIDALRPRRLVGLGRDAEQMLARWKSSHCVVSLRHPSYGGQPIFRRQLRELYGS